MTPVKISVLIPAYNEEAVIHIPIKRCFDAFKTYNLSGEVVIMDSSTDKTSIIATELGCKVVPIPKLGIGKAYIEGVKHVSGDYIIMGDADGTYDFMEMKAFIELLDTGYDFVMGTRLKGTIKKGAMPWSHRFIGTPILTSFINLFYNTSFTDCNSGLRAITKDAYKKIKLQSFGWEYASEMILKSARLGLKMTEIPVSLSPDQHNRIPHLNPWLAGWMNLRLIFLLACDKLFFQAGLLCYCFGSIVTIGLFFGSLTVYGYTFGMFYMFIGLILSILGLQLLLAAFFVKKGSFLNQFQNISFFNPKHIILSFEKSLTICIGLGIISFILFVFVFMNWRVTQLIDMHNIKQGLMGLYLLVNSSYVFLYAVSTYLFSIKQND